MQSAAAAAAAAAEMSSGDLTSSPLHISACAASVPFRWEEEPGKPRQSLHHPSSNSIVDFAPKSLHLPPRLLLINSIHNNNVSKLTSPTSVLEGPYIGKPSKVQSFSAFRVMRRRERERYGSFRRGNSPERGQYLIRTIINEGTDDSNKREHKERGILGSWRWSDHKRGKREVGAGDGDDGNGGSYVSPSPTMETLERSERGTVEIKSEEEDRIKRAGSFSSTSHARPQFWATIYEGLKQLVPWRSRKLKKDAFLI